MGILEDGDNVTQKEIDEFSPKEGQLARELAAVFNKYNAESVSGTPDYVLAEVALEAIKAFNEAVHKRAEWRGESVGYNPTAHMDPIELSEPNEATLIARANAIGARVARGDLPPKNSNGFYVWDEV